jgi:glycyl-tRNA synthetase
VLMVLCEAYREEEVKGEQRVVLAFHPEIAPITVAVLPLVKKDGMPEIAHAIEADLRRHFNTFYDEKGAIGRRYRRMDEVGTPFAVTIDGQTLEDGTVTLRERDSMEQIRISRDQVATALFDQIRNWQRPA